MAKSKEIEESVSAVLVCALFSAAYEWSFFDIFEFKRGIGQYVALIPQWIWSVVESGIVLWSFSVAKDRIMGDTKRFKSLWIWVYILYVFVSILSIFASEDSSGVSVIGLIVSMSMAILMAILGFRISKNYEGENHTYGRFLMYFPGIYLVGMIVLMAMIPNDYGILEYHSSSYGRYERTLVTYSESTKLWSVILVIYTALESTLLVGMNLSTKKSGNTGAEQVAMS